MHGMYLIPIMHWQHFWQQLECLQRQPLSALRAGTGKQVILNNGLRQPGFESPWGRQLGVYPDSLAA
jgi:hypothetical protein